MSKPWASKLSNKKYLSMYKLNQLKVLGMKLVVTKESAQPFSFLKIWETTKFIISRVIAKSNHLDIIIQWTSLKLVKTLTIIMEFDFIQRLFHLISLTCSIIVMPAISSAIKALSSLKKLAKVPKRLTSTFLKIPSQEQETSLVKPYYIWSNPYKEATKKC